MNDSFIEQPWSSHLDYSTVGGIVAVIIVVIVAVSYSKKKKRDE